MKINGEDDLDADLALFETQIQRVRAATKVPEKASQVASQQETKPCQLSQSITQAPVSESTHQKAQLTLPPAAPTPQQTQRSQNSTIASKSQSVTQPTGRWFWNGTTWRWRSFPNTQTTTIQPHVLPSTKPKAPTPVPKKPSTKRTAAGAVWNDPTLLDWPTDDHRLFVGDLAPDATEQHLSDAFGVYPSYAMARVIRDKRSGACRGYGFVSFTDGRDMVRALRELNGKYVGGRPVKLKRGKWQKRCLKDEKWKELKAFQKIAKK